MSFQKNCARLSLGQPTKKLPKVLPFDDDLEKHSLLITNTFGVINSLPSLFNLFL